MAEIPKEYQDCEELLEIFTDTWLKERYTQKMQDLLQEKEELEKKEKDRKFKKKAKLVYSIVVGCIIGYVIGDLLWGV